jgi:hypothetical protein
MQKKVLEKSLYGNEQERINNISKMIAESKKKMKDLKAFKKQLKKKINKEVVNYMKSKEYKGRRSMRAKMWVVQGIVAAYTVSEAALNIYAGSNGREIEFFATGTGLEYLIERGLESYNGRNDQD